jgi:hypothetical protein
MSDDDKVVPFPVIERIDELLKPFGFTFRYYTLVNRAPVAIDTPVRWAEEVARRMMMQKTYGVEPGASGAGAILLQRTLQLSFDHNAVISVPSFVADASGGFVGEGLPIPARSLLAQPVYRLRVANGVALGGCLAA